MNDQIFHQLERILVKYLNGNPNDANKWYAIIDQSKICIFCPTSRGFMTSYEINAIFSNKLKNSSIQEANSLFTQTNLPMSCKSDIYMILHPFELSDKMNKLENKIEKVENLYNQMNDKLQLIVDLLDLTKK